MTEPFDSVLEHHRDAEATEMLSDSPQVSGITPEKRAVFSPFWVWSGVGLAVIGSAVFLWLTPPGVLAKANYIAAAVCHRIPSHSFFIDGHQLPLCQRCTGTFPGALTGVLVQWGLWRRRRAQKFPPWPVSLLLAGLASIWGLDGFNSYTTFFTGGPEGVLGYAPQPWLRLLTGILMGMGMSVLLVPAFNLTMWRDGTQTRALRTWQEFGFLIGVELAVAGLIYLLEPALLYPITLYSVIGVLIMFILLGAMIFVMLLGKDTAFARWREAWVPLVWGLVFALTIVGVMDFLRLALIGQVNGVPGLL
ncbi:MAG: DUF2085 domain-containing protein [Anaerolineae bacterium]|nr:DUF2085 domain-containing protein [Anaerolineae bacterium]